MIFWEFDDPNTEGGNKWASMHQPPQLHTVRYDELPALESGSAAATVATLGTCGQANGTNCGHHTKVVHICIY